MKKVAKTSDGDNLASATEANKGGGSGQAPSEGCSPCSTKSDVLESTARNSDSSSEDGVADHEDSSLINHACGFGSDALGDAADPPPSTTTGTPLLGPTQASAMVVNYISMGYVLLPYGKQELKAWSPWSHDHPRHPTPPISSHHRIPSSQHSIRRGSSFRLSYLLWWPFRATSRQYSFSSPMLVRKG